MAVTAAEPPTGVALTEGVIYQYDLTFDFDDNVSFDLATATRNASLSYGSLKLPSFCLPPADINDLRLLFGSCRIPHGNGRDAFAVGDGLIAQAAENADGPPASTVADGGPDLRRTTFRPRC